MQLGMGLDGAILALIWYNFCATVVLGIPSAILAFKSPCVARRFWWLYGLTGFTFCLMILFGLLFMLFGNCPVCGISHF